MEVGESGARQRISSARNTQHTDRGILNHPDRYDQPRDYSNSSTSSNRPSYARDANSTSSMATAALISPNTPYYPHHPTSYASSSSGSYHHAGSSQAPQSAPGMISPVESRRTSDEHDLPPHRQALPSIQEVIGKGPGSAYQTSAAPLSVPQQSLPSPFSSTGPPRPFPTEASGERQPSPRTMHHPAPSTPFSQRPDPTSSFPNPLRPPLSGRSHPVGAHPSPPLGVETHQGGLPSSTPLHQSQQQAQQQHHQHPRPPPDQHQHQQSQSPQHPQHPQQQQHHQPAPQHHPYHQQAPQQRDGRPKHDDSPPPHGAYPPHPSSQQHSYSSQPAPPHQLPLPPAQPPHGAPYPISPRHSGPSSLPSPFEAHPQNSLQDTPQDYNRPRTRYDQAVNRHFEAWSYAEYLDRIGASARTIYNFAEAFGSIAREEHGPQPIPGRMPSEREFGDMISNAEWLKAMLENLRGMVQQTVVNDRGPGGSRQKTSTYEDMDVSMYNESVAKPYAMSEVKKRRGRAAPPGRCHSCNRIDTPEWRRGPDGARTLCNACGLHYAKLERKKQMENRQIRPKHPDERH